MSDEQRPKGMKIVFSSRKKVEKLAPYVDRILEAIGVSRAYVSDLSTLGDFAGFFESQLETDDQEEIDKAVAREFALVAERLGVPAETTDYLWVIAERLKERE